jgi:hypothetical protein
MVLASVSASGLASATELLRTVVDASSLETQRRGLALIAIQFTAAFLISAILHIEANRSHHRPDVPFGVPNMAGRDEH